MSDSQPQIHIRRSALRIAAIYALVAAAWIALSDSLIALLVRNTDLQALLHTSKGVLFVLVTGTLLYHLIARDLQRIHRTEQRYHILFDSSHDALTVFDQSGRYLDANTAAQRLSGYSRSELLQRNITDLMPSEERTADAERARSFLMIDTPAATFTRHLLRKDGQLIPVEITLGPQMIFGERVYLAAIRDVTAQREAAAALQQSEARWRSLFEHAPLGITIVLGGRNLYANPAYVQLLGYDDPSELIGRPLSEQVAPQSRAEIMERNRRREAGLPEAHSYEIIGRRKDGSEFPCQVHVTRIELPEGTATVGFVVDISQRKQSELYIQRQSERANTLAEISRALAEHNLDHHAVLTTMVERTSQVVGDGCVIRLLRSDHTVLETAASYHRNPEMRRAMHHALDDIDQPYNDDLYGQVISTGQPQRIARLEKQVAPELIELGQRYGAHSGLIVPLRAHGRILGTMLVLRRVEQPLFNDDDQLFIQELADRAALAVDNARLYYASQEEIIERRRIELALRESEEQYRMLFDYHPQPVWVYDAETLAFLAVNDAAVRQYGYSRDEFLQMKLTDIPPPEDVPDLLQLVRKESQRPRSMGVHRHRRKDGTLIDVEITRHSLDFAGRAARLVLALDVTERRRAERTLQASEANLRAMFDSANQSIMLIGPDERLIAFNKYAQTGAQSVVGQQMTAGEPILAYIPVEDHQDFKQRFRLTLAGRSSMIERLLALPDGPEWWEFHFNPIVLPSGDVNGILFAARNITERKQAEEALRLSEERLRTVVTHAPIVLTALDRHGTITLIEGRGLESLGLTPDDLIGRSVVALYPELTVEEQLQHVFAGEDSTSIDRRGEITFETRWTPLRDREGAIASVIVVSTDVTEREQAVARLRETEGREQAILHGTTDGIFLKDLDGRYLLVNPSTARRLGTTIDGALGKHDDDFFPAPIAARFCASDREVLTSGQQVQIEEELLIDGRRHSFLILKSPYRDIAGNLQGVIGIARDITELKQTIEALRKSEATNRALLDAIPDFMFRLSREGCYLDYHTPKNAQPTVIPIGVDLTGKHLTRVVSADMAQQTLACLERTLSSGEMQTIHYQFIFEGKQQEYESRFVRSGPNEVLVIGRDVSEQKRLERALRDARDVYLTLVEEIPMLVWRADAAGTINFVNKRWAEFAGYDVEHLPDDVVAALIHPLDQERYTHDATSAWEQQRAYEIEYRMRRHDGVYCWVEVRATPFYDENGQFAGYIGTCSDINERKQQEQIKDDFLALASHELKTPLAALIGYIHLLERWSAQQDVSDRISQALSAMTSEGMRLNRLINDLLDVSRIQTGKLHMFMHPTNLTDLLQHCIDNLRVMLPSHTWRLEVAPGPPLTLCVDAQRIEQVLTNLCTNAAKYSAEHAPVIVSLRRDVQSAQITVRDCGLGIPPSDLPYIFDRFYQVQRPTRESRPGLGLGLYITREIIRQHGGTISVESVEHGGSIFTILLPLEHTADITIERSTLTDRRQ